MKSAIAATLAVAAGLFAANMLGVAVAEAPTTTSLRTISVEGVATLPIGQFDNAAAATAVYREGMAGAVTDGQSKAEFLAGKVGATLGAVQSLAEGGGSIWCDDPLNSEYEGEQPDFGSAAIAGATTLSATAVAPSRQSAGVVHRTTAKHRKRKHPKAKKASAASCTLTAQVSLVYGLN